MTKALTLLANTSSEPASSPGTANGSVTCHSVRQWPAPSARLAWRRLGSMLSNAVIKGSTISGSSICASATTTAPGVYSSLMGSAIQPSSSRAVLTMPWRPRITTQAKVRTTALVSSGSTISSISGPCQRAGASV